MSYVVIESDSPENPRFREFGDLQAAVEYLETTCGGTDSTGARLCRLDPVDFELKQYFKVEIPGGSQPTVLEEPSLDQVDEPKKAMSAAGMIAGVVGLDPDPVVADNQMPGESRRGLFGH